ncbi:transcription initiation factor E subunit alpha [Methanobrevibacter cuticularis]|uniref:Transcription factor E n=1 Tax=Methanobrevibacter cuticularis TaxID=47311 RepID=A0A166DNP1_9EURY|nr:transcription factor E [Methanobrevibacter cuticularis]KZX15795.1 transcription initiation factor E subunit alpha [Methanobrevibacter cuticularis]
MLRNPLVQELLYGIIQEEENMCIVECLINGITTDEEIAEKTEIKLNIVRKVLYKLYDSGLASYKRSKDPETQWYTYAWEFDSSNVMNQLEEKATNRIGKLKQLLDVEEGNMYFVCPSGHSRFTFDEASEKGFVCPDCGEETKFEENDNIIRRIKEEIKAYEESYSFIKTGNAK